MIRLRSPWKRAAALAADATLGAIAPLLTSGSRSAIMPPAPRVLLVRCDHIGDAAMASAVLGPLRDALHPSQLDVLTGPWAADLFRAHPHVDDGVTFATPWWCAARGATVGARVVGYHREPVALHT